MLSCLLPLPPRVPKHPRWVYHTLLPPKYKISCPKSCAFPPNVPNSEHDHLTTTSGIVDLYLLAAPTPPPTAPPPLHTPALLSGTLGISNTLPATQKTLLVILTSPGTLANTLIYTVFWLVGFCPYTLIMYVGLNPSIDI